MAGDLAARREAVPVSALDRLPLRYAVAGVLLLCAAVGAVPFLL